MKTAIGVASLLAMLGFLATATVLTFQQEHLIAQDYFNLGIISLLVTTLMSTTTIKK